jgi:Nuclease-related domain
LKSGHSATRSPLKAATLMNPGESIGLEIRRLLVEDYTPYLFLSAIFVVLAFCEWGRWLFGSPPSLLSAVSLTVVAFVALAYSTIKVIRIKRQLRNLGQGMEGEKAVGQYLERLREKGYQVLHDVPGENFNIDHVVIGRAGIFVIETKTISKPKSGNAIIEYDGKQVSVNGFTPERNPITQAKALTTWVKELIKESTGRNFPVRPVVLYPGWFITKQPRGAEVWVLNPKGLPSFLENQEKILPPEDVHLATYHLCRYIRNCNNDKKHRA